MRSMRNLHHVEPSGLPATFCLACFDIVLEFVIALSSFSLLNKLELKLCLSSLLSVKRQNERRILYPVC